MAKAVPVQRSDISGGRYVKQPAEVDVSLTQRRMQDEDKQMNPGYMSAPKKSGSKKQPEPRLITIQPAPGATVESPEERAGRNDSLTQRRTQDDDDFPKPKVSYDKLVRGNSSTRGLSNACARWKHSLR
jgi:hypothetical protein